MGVILKMMNELNCPFCGKENNIDYSNTLSPYNHSLSPYIRHQMKCRYCDKNYLFEVEYEPVFTEFKADCTQGDEHSFIDYNLNTEKCIYCSKEQRKGR